MKNDLKRLREEVITEDLGDREWWRSLVEVAIGIKDMENVEVHTSKGGEREAAANRVILVITLYNPILLLL